MESFLSRFRQLTVLLLLLMAQLLLLAYQVRTNQEVRLIRIWAVTAVTPLARAVTSISSYWRNVIDTLIRQRETMGQNAKLKAEVARLKLDNQYLQTELATADRAAVLLAFRQTLPSKTLAARTIGSGTGANARVVYLDRGSTDGVKRGMAVITAGGIVGKVVSAYPTAALVTLVTQQGFAAGVISQKSRIKGTLRGVGSDQCAIESLRNPYAVADQEWFFTSGDDRIFPKGLPVGQVRLTRRSSTELEFRLIPVGLENLEEVLVVVEGVHGAIPEPAVPQTSSEITVLPAPPAGGETGPAETEGGAAPAGTDADRLAEKYRKIGEAQGHTYGAAPGRVPDFNRESQAPAPKPAKPSPQDAVPSAPAAPKETVPPKP